MFFRGVSGEGYIRYPRRIGDVGSEVMFGVNNVGLSFGLVFMRIPLVVRSTSSTSSYMYTS